MVHRNKKYVVRVRVRLRYISCNEDEAKTCKVWGIGQLEAKNTNGKIVVGWVWGIGQLEAKNTNGKIVVGWFWFGNQSLGHRPIGSQKHKWQNSCWVVLVWEPITSQ